jgi:hypothetical protein
MFGNAPIAPPFPTPTTPSPSTIFKLGPSSKARSHNIPCPPIQGQGRLGLCILVVKEGSAVPWLRFGVHGWKGGVLKAPGAPHHPEPQTQHDQHDLLSFISTSSLLHRCKSILMLIHILNSIPHQSLQSRARQIKWGCSPPPIHSDPDAQPQNGPAKIPTPWRRIPGTQAQDPQSKSNATLRRSEWQARHSDLSLDLS